MYFKTTDKKVLEEANKINDKRKKRIESFRALNKLFMGTIKVRNGADPYGYLLPFAGCDFNGKQQTKGWKNANNNGLSFPKKNNRDVWDKINAIPKVNHNSLLAMLNFPAGGIFRNASNFHEQNLLFSIAYSLVQNRTILLFEFPDEYLTDCNPQWTAPDHAVEILSSEYHQLKQES